MNPLPTNWGSRYSSLTELETGGAWRKSFSPECVISRIPAEELFEATSAFAGMETANCILYVPKG